MGPLTRAQAAASRADSGTARGAAPGRLVRSWPVAGLRAQPVTHAGRDMYQVDGYASVVEQPYEMFDVFGPYDEVVDQHAFDNTLAAKPDVAFLLNHTGLTMARTTNGTLDLSVDSHGLRVAAYLPIDRGDVADLVSAIGDRLVDQMSFAFRCDQARWSEDLTTFRLLELDLNRGDVSAVNYGANPATSIAVRAAARARTRTRSLAAVEALLIDLD